MFFARKKRARPHLGRRAALILALALLIPWQTPAGAAPEEIGEGVVRLPIIMYHRVTKRVECDPVYSVTPDELALDLRYLRDRGYRTVTLSDLIAFAYNGIALPEKAVMLTFDDGESSLHRYVLPLMKKYDMRAVAGIIGVTADTYTRAAQKLAYYPNLTWPQIREMVQSGRFEIQNHSYDLHKNKSGWRGALRRWDESQDRHMARLRVDLERMQERTREETGAAPTAFLYPFGLYSAQTEELLREMGFLASMTCEKGVNRLPPLRPDALFSLKRNNRPHGVGQWKFFSALGIV